MQTVNVLNVTKPSCSCNTNVNLLVRFTLCQFWFEILHCFDFFLSVRKKIHKMPVLDSFNFFKN